jgi:hypothetical protein
MRVNEPMLCSFGRVRRYACVIEPESQDRGGGTATFAKSARRPCQEGDPVEELVTISRLERAGLAPVSRNSAITNHHVWRSSQRHMKGGEWMLGNTILATIVRKGEDPTGQFYIIVRSSAMAGDKVIPNSQEEYDELHPGMLVEVHRVGWGVFSTWRLRR